ncbi:hypothetical protein AM493_18440 [Flavobacterium akiainvivens]|uniref:Lipocalin-like domain-containing protein n=1 Tax=Flavobacterium akiainvivens TaxID=1202724 RepID=A0A0M9VJJ7_9FLAO|nr:hypothetical protein [Flavobacterium akiainvivens]KOS07810.1 hypothetical protein AM493_18440 [Flavobacterium akiainvivens]SFQ26822.1 hypothetical protein SAMN05444144_102270 [Flavobacterium akiainvivens]
MKKLLLTAGFMLAAVALHAQTITQEQLQGKWRLVTYNDNNGSIDIVKGTWKVNDDVQNKVSIEEQYNDIVLQAQEAVLTIKGNTASQTVMGEEHSGSFTLQDKDGKTYMTVDQDTTTVPQVFIKDNALHLADAGVGMEMIYKPIK